MLLGLIQDNRLEITNCFPFPSSKPGEDEDEDEGKLVLAVKHIHLGINGGSMNYFILLDKNLSSG